MWLSSTDFGKTGLHTLHETTSADGIHWAEPSPSLLGTRLLPDGAQERRRLPDVVRRRQQAALGDSPRHQRRRPQVERAPSEPVLQLSQPWEAEIVVYPCVLKIDGVYLMWYGSYYYAVRRQTTAIGFAASTDGLHWHKHPQNPVLRSRSRAALGIELRHQRLRDAAGRRQLSLLVRQPQGAAL